jgi:hypothetical protein
MTTFESVMQRFAAISDDAFAQPWSGWGNENSYIYTALFRAYEQEQAALIRAYAERRPPEARMIFARAQAAYGDFVGILIGLDDAYLDRVPDASDVSTADMRHASIKPRSTIRQVLRHVLGVERRTAARVEWTLRRRDDEPVPIPQRPDYQDSDVVGGMTEILARFASMRAQTNALESKITDALLLRPAGWSKTEVDLGFLLNRFASHVLEHTIQLDEFKIEALGLRQGQARRVVRGIWSRRGELEVIAPDRQLLDGLTAEHAKLLESVEQRLRESVA